MIRNQDINRLEPDMENHTGKKQNTHPGKSNTGRYLIAALFITGVAAFIYFDLGRYLTLDALKQNREALLQFTREHYLATVFLFVLAYYQSRLETSCLLITSYKQTHVFRIVQLN